METVDELYKMLSDSKKLEILDRSKKRVVALGDGASTQEQKEIILEETVSMIKDMHTTLLRNVDQLFEDDSSWTPHHIYGYREVAKFWKHQTSQSALSLDKD